MQAIDGAKSPRKGCVTQQRTPISYDQLISIPRNSRSSVGFREETSQFRLFVRSFVLLDHRNELSRPAGCLSAMQLVCCPGMRARGFVPFLSHGYDVSQGRRSPRAHAFVVHRAVYFFSQHHAAAQPCPRNPVVGLLEHSMRYSTAYNDGEPRALPRHRPKSPSHGTNRVIFCLGFFCSFVELALFQCPQHPADG